MKNSIKELIPFLISIFVFILILFFYYTFILISNSGYFIYPLDDAYIHLKLSKNLAETGILGININQFAFMTSSPVWTLLLSIGYIIGVKTELFPLFMNFLISQILIYSIWIELKRKQYTKKQIYLMLILIIMLIPLFHLSIIGMEHLLHALLSLLLLFNLRKYLVEKSTNLLSISILSFLLPVTRYESIFIIISFVLISLLLTKYKLALSLIIPALLSISLVGLYSVSNGWYFFPTSVLLKGSMSEDLNVYNLVRFLFYLPVKKLYLNPGMISVLVGLSVLFFLQTISNLEESKINKMITLSVILFIILHLIFAQLGWFYRYEAYLIILGIVWILINFDFIADFKLKLAYKVTLILLLLIPVSMRSIEIHSKVIYASNNIYSQQYQISNFLHRYYPGKSIAIHDIGAVSYFSEITTVDLWGLADKRFYKLKSDNQYSADKINSILIKDSVEIAILYTQWFEGERNFLKSWIKTGYWEIKNNVICGEPRINFFAKDSIIYHKLVRNLRNYSGSLPLDVVHKIEN